MLESNFFCYIHFPDRQERCVAHKLTALTTFFFHRATTDIQEQCGEEQKIFRCGNWQHFFSSSDDRQTVRGTAKKFFVVATDNIFFSQQTEITYRSKLLGRFATASHRRCSYADSADLFDRCWPLASSCSWVLLGNKFECSSSSRQQVRMFECDLRCRLLAL